MNMYYLLALVLVAFSEEQAEGMHVRNGKKDPCEDYYCANGGVCISNCLTIGHWYNGRHSKPTCQCIGDWKGDRCDDNPCKDVSCNTGTCLFDDNGSTHCCCPAGTLGEFCEIIDDPCKNVDCNGGTCLLDENGQARCSCPESTSGDFCEVAMTCPQLESPLNGQVSKGDRTVGSSATFACFETFALCGQSILTCGNDEEWDADIPVCLASYNIVTKFTVAYGDSTYYFSNEFGSAYASQEYCEDLGGNLLTINSNEEWEFIKCLLSQDTSAVSRWIGLMKNDGTWEWTSGQPVTVTYWSPAPTNSDICTFINTENWHAVESEDCNFFASRFICETNNA